MSALRLRSREYLELGSSRLSGEGRHGVASYWQSPPSSRFSLSPIFLCRKKSLRPTPREVLETPIFLHNCLAVQQFDRPTVRGKASERGRRGAFLLLWVLTIVLAPSFLYGTGPGMAPLIYEHGLTISTNVLEQRTTRWLACTPFTLPLD